MVDTRKTLKDKKYFSLPALEEAGVAKILEALGRLAEYESK